MNSGRQLLENMSNLELNLEVDLSVTSASRSMSCTRLRLSFHSACLFEPFEGESEVRVEVIVLLRFRLLEAVSSGIVEK